MDNNLMFYIDTLDKLFFITKLENGMALDLYYLYYSRSLEILNFNKFYNVLEKYCKIMV